MTRVVVAMSGGVDSSVAAALLKQQGYDVVGMMLTLWSEPGREGSNRCCSPDAMVLARNVAAILDIPFYAIDAKDVFRSSVVEYFLDGYLQGITPNPCLECNRIVRWSFLLDHALVIGADFLATGHYVRLRTVRSQNSQTKTIDQFQLMKSADPHKDQSYILHVLNQEQLKRAKFPVGDYHKEEVRRLADQFGLPTASRPESQDLCFLAGEDYREFLKRNAPESLKQGDIVDINGNHLGKHRGLSFYTIGQRKGLKLSSTEPLFVISKNVHENTLVVGLKDKLGRSRLEVKEVNWISGETPHGTFRAEVKIRYSASPSWAEVSPGLEGDATLRFNEPQRDITPGQSAVFYVGDVVVGGGIIQ
jgi:tRNA-specific 2-thiouridylase